MTLLLWRPQTGTGAPPPTPSLPTASVTYDARIAWRPQQHDICQNDGFETDTTGWSASSGINAAGASITRVTSDPYSGSANGRIVTNAVADSGAHYDFGTANFGRLPYTAVVYLRRVSGGRRATITLGSEGTPSQRASIDVTLTDDWRPYSVVWFPDVLYADVQLAITTGDDLAVTMDVDAVDVYTDRLSQMPWLPAVTEGWLSDGSGQAAACTLTSDDSDAFAGISGEPTSFTVSTTSSTGSGIDYYLAGRYHAGRTYRLRVALKSSSGSTSCRLRFGASGDQTDSTVTMATSWGWHTVDWTPAADTYAAIVSITNASAAANVFRADMVEVYEAADDVTLAELNASHGSRFDGRSEPPGRITATILDPDGTYSPRNTASTIYGYVKTGRPFFVRASYEGQLFPVTYGTITRLTPSPFDKSVALNALDGLADLDVQIDLPFTADRSYATVRGDVLDWTPGTVTNGAPVLHGYQRYMTTKGIESSTFYAGTDSTASALDILAAINEVTGSSHYARPRASAVRPWLYVTTDRASLTDDDAGWTLNDDMQRMADVSMRSESLITRQRVTFQGYETRGAETVAEATSSVPYLVYAHDEYGSSERPEPEDIYRLRRQRGKKKRRRRRKLKWVGRRWVDAIIPISVAAGERYTFRIEFLVPVEDVSATATGASATVVEVGPSAVDIHIDAWTGGDTVTAVSVTGKAYVPLDEVEEAVTIPGVVVSEGAPIDSEYIPSAGAAHGLAEYLTWRYSESRFRPSYVLQHDIKRQALTRIGAHVTMTADRWDISADRYVIRGVEHTISRGGMEWETTLELEELPPGGTWFTLNSTSHGLDSSAVLAH